MSEVDVLATELDTLHDDWDLDRIDMAEGDDEANYHWRIELFPHPHNQWIIAGFDKDIIECFRKAITFCRERAAKGLTP